LLRYAGQYRNVLTSKLVCLLVDVMALLMA
jgi:hypothetical protein